MPIIRAAKPSDAKKLATLAEKTFRDTFGGVNAIEDMAPMVGQRGSMTTSLRGASRMLAPGFSEGICSARFVVPGPT